jgi:hypothetical protein
MSRPSEFVSSVTVLAGAHWSASDLEDLKGHVAHGASLEETAAFLCRAGTPFEVAAKAKELGLKWQAGGTRRKPLTTWQRGNASNVNT